MFSKPSVLIVDQSAETREVLRTALEKEGIKIWEATRADRGLELVRQHHPQVIVLDVEIADRASAEVRAGFSSTEAQPIPIVLLGAAGPVTQNFPNGQYVAKPYHYGPLIRKIEGLLDEVRRPRTKIA